MERWHLCERWWARRFACVYHRLPEEVNEEDDEDESVKKPVPLLVPAKKPTGGVGSFAVAELLEPAIPLPVPLPVGAGGRVLEPPPYIPFVPVVPKIPPVFVPPPPLVVPWPAETVARPPFIVPDDPFGGGMVGSTPALIESLEDGNGVNVNPADAARAVGIAVAAVIVVAALSRGVPPAVVRQVASVVGAPFLLPSILGTAERALIDAIDDSVEQTVQFAPSEMFWGAGGTPDPDSRPVGSGPRGSRPPLLFNAAARMEGLLQGITSDF